MEPRRILAAIVGVAQSAIGVLAAVFVCIIYFNLLSVQSIVNLPTELRPLGLLVLAVFSFFSIISGVFLALEGLGHH